MTDAEKAIYDGFAREFPAGEIKVKPQTVKGNRALAVFYVDARLVADRLDEVVGPGHWQDDFESRPDGSVVCRLQVKIGDEWVVKTDVGSPSEQPDEHDRVKSAFSDALKRAAVKFGIGRYLYRIPNSWWDYDPAKRQFVVKPTPGAQPSRSAQASNTPQNSAAVTTPPKQTRVPVSGKELVEAVEKYESRICDGVRHRKGCVFQHLVLWGKRCVPALPPDIEEWPVAAIPHALKELSDLRKKMEAAPVPESKPEPVFVPPTQKAETTDDGIGAREEAEILTEKLHDLAAKIGQGARELIDSHRTEIGAPHGTKRFGELTVKQCRALVTILENLAA